MLRTLRILFLLICGLIFSQAPQFMMQYQHQLRGHVDELNIHVGAIHRLAQQSGKSVIQYVDKFLESEDGDFQSQGKMMLGMRQRLERLAEGLWALDHASLLTKPFLFLVYLDEQIMRSTWQHFDIGISLTWETMTYALCGALLGYFLFHGVCRFFRACAAHVRVRT